jgi:hypothetical protein
VSFPSTFLDLQRSVVKKLRLAADPDAGTGDDLQKVKDWINWAYADACVKTEASQTSATMALTANSSTYTLPSAVLRIKYIAVKPVGNTDYGGDLSESSLDEILDFRRGGGGTNTGAVTHYALLGLTQLELWPTPSGADTLLMYYVALPTALSAATDLPILQEPYATDVLENGAARKGAEFLYGPASPDVQYYGSLHQQALRDLRSHLLRRGGGRTQQLAVAGSWIPWLPHDPSVDSGV